MQIVAYGAQDLFLTGTPEITYWKVSYRRHTNFAMESIEQTFSGQADFGRRVTCTISRNGDLGDNPVIILKIKKTRSTTGSSSSRMRIPDSKSCLTNDSPSTGEEFPHIRQSE